MNLPTSEPISICSTRRTGLACSGEKLRSKTASRDPRLQRTRKRPLLDLAASEHLDEEGTSRCSTFLESFESDLVGGSPISSGVNDDSGDFSIVDSCTATMNAPLDTVDDHALPVPPKRSSVRAPRRQGLLLRMEQRLLCGLVENLAPPNHSATTVEHGNRTKARAICDHVYSCQGDWLNEPTLRLLDFYHLINDDARLLCWLARRRLISNQMRCNKSGCDSPLFLTPDRANMDGWSWHCGHCRRKRSIRHQSIFAHSNLPIKIATQILFLWSVGHPEELIAFDAGTSTQDADDWLHCIREVCRETNTSIRERIGGIEVEGNGNEPGYCRVVEVDESMFSCWLRDPKSGPVLRKIWLLGGVERGTERVFLTRCPKNARDASSLIPIIRDFVKPETAIITDEWEGYASLGRLPEGYQHYVTDRTKGIVCPDQSAVHIQKITGQWSHWKRSFESLNGTRTDEFEARLDEFLWRMRHSKSILQSFCYSVTFIFKV